MKKAKVLVATVLASGLVLSGCTFEEGLDIAKSWANNNVAQPAVNFWNEKILGKKVQEPEKEKEEKQDEGEKPAPAPVAQLTSISISGQFKTEYEVGESFDATGIVVTAVYDDGSTKDVSSQASFSGFSSEQKGPVTVTVSFEGQTAEFTVNVLRTQWSSEVKALMEENLYGIVLPFIDKDELSFELKNSWVVGSGAEVTASELANYLALFSEAAGYEEITSEYESNIVEGSFKAFRKSAATAEGTRYIDVLVYALNAAGDDYALEGALNIQAADTYEYAFPDTSALFTKYPLLTPFDIPTLDLPDGGYYYVAEGSNNELAYSYGADYFTYMKLIVWGYNASEETFAAFQEKFADWSVTVSSGTYTARLTVNSEKYAEVQFSYSASEKIIRYNITLGLYDVPTWPTATAAALVEAVAPGSSTVLPACPGGDKYTYWASLKEIDVKGPETLLDDYAAILVAAGWTETSAGSDQFVSPAGDILVSLDWNSTYGLEITVSVPPLASWPASEIAEAFETVGETPFDVPALEGDGFSYEFNDGYISSYGVAAVYVSGSATEDDCVAYASALTTAGWTVEEDDGDYWATLTTDNGIQKINFYWSSYYSEITVYIYLVLDPLPAAEWPADEIAAYLGNSVTDPVPEYAGEASSFQFFADYGTVVISIEAGTEDAAIAAYQAQLTTAGYTAYREDSYGDMQYLSENNQVLANVYKYADGQIAVYVAPSPVYSAFPVELVNAFLSAKGFGFSVSADMFANISATTFEYGEGSYYGYDYIQIIVGGSYAAQFDEVLAPVLEAAGFEYYADYEQYYNAAYSSVGISEEDGFTYITIME